MASSAKLHMQLQQEYLKIIIHREYCPFSPLFPELDQIPSLQATVITRLIQIFIYNNYWWIFSVKNP